MTRNSKILRTRGVGFCAALVIALCWYAIAINYSPIPYWDSWGGQMDFLLRYEQGTPSQKLAALFEQHNEHRFVYTRLIFLLDNTLFQSAFYTHYLFNALAPLIPVLVVFALLKELDVHTRFMLTALASCLLFLLVQRENFFWEFQSQFFLAQYLPFLGYYLVIRFWSDRPVRNALTITLASLATAFTMANGLFFALPMALVFALQQGFRAYAVFCAALFAALCVLYFQVLPYESIENHGSIRADVLPNFARYLLYVFTYVGSPFGRTLAPIMGLLYVGAALTLFVKEIRENRPVSMTTVLLLFMLFYGISTAATGAGRVNFGVGQALSGRYLTPTLLAWVCLALLFALRADWTRIPERIKLWVPISLAVIFVGLQLSEAYPDTHRHTERELALMSVQLEAGDREQTQLQLYPSMEFVRHIYFASRERGLHFAQARAAWDRIGETGITSVLSSCKGAVDGVALLEGPFVRLEGWIWDEASALELNSRLGLISDGTIIGLGLVGLHRPDVENVFGGDTRFSGFRLYARAMELEAPMVLQMLDLSPSCSLAFDASQFDLSDS